MRPRRAYWSRPKLRLKFRSIFEFLFTVFSQYFLVSSFVVVLHDCGKSLRERICNLKSLRFLSCEKLGCGFFKSWIFHCARCQRWRRRSKSLTRRLGCGCLLVSPVRVVRKDLRKPRSLAVDTRTIFFRSQHAIHAPPLLNFRDVALRTCTKERVPSNDTDDHSCVKRAD